MKKGPTVIFGAVAAAATALADLTTAPPWLHLLSLALAACSFALFGFFLAAPSERSAPRGDRSRRVGPLAISLTIMLLSAGCTAASRTTTARDGSVTSSRIATLLTTVSGFSDSVQSPDGVQSQTRLDNYSSDIAAIQALGQVLQSTLSQVLLLTNVTNFPITNTTTTQPKLPHTIK